MWSYAGRFQLNKHPEYVNLTVIIDMFLYDCRGVTGKLSVAEKLAGMQTGLSKYYLAQKDKKAFLTRKEVAVYLDYYPTFIQRTYLAVIKHFLIYF